MTPEEKMDNVLAKQMAICGIMEQCSWIPVSERLPEPWVVVIVCTDDDDEADVGCVDALKQWRNPHTGDMAVSSVTHWTPLPAPPTDRK